MSIPGNRNEVTVANTDRIDIDALAAQIATAMPDLDPASQQAALTLLRLLAQGEPLDVRRLAETLALPAAYVEETLERSPGVFRDGQRRVIGFMGLSVVEVGDHRIHIDGRALWAQCAWDTLFLPELLDESARVSSRCPSTGESISLTVTPAGVAEVAPPETVVSLIVPEAQFGRDVVQSFCHFVHFFASPNAAASWAAQHPGTFPLSIDDAYRLGQLTNRATFGAALA
ncbi:MAG: organomercurial lyase [Solirubrobacteraceae bacterium]